MIYKYVSLITPKPKMSVFIVGCGHTGTTLLARILATHPDVFSPPYETNAFLGRSGPHWNTVTRLLVKAAWSRKPVLIEKSPYHIHHTDIISQVIPRTRFIVATRDGRDTVASLGKRYDGDFKRAFERWLIDSKASRTRLSEGDSILWKYEDFIESPSESLCRLCDFIGIPYTDNLLDYHKNPVDWGRNSTEKSAHGALRRRQVNKPVEDNRGKWKQDLPTEVVGWFDQDEARLVLAHFGYS